MIKLRGSHDTRVIECWLQRASHCIEVPSDLLVQYEVKGNVEDLIPHFHFYLLGSHDEILSARYCRPHMGD